jgi:hypothetical protein
MIASECECRIDECVGFDECTVKINTERRKRCDLSWGGRNGQRSILPIEAVSQGLRFARLPNTDHASVVGAVFFKNKFTADFNDPALIYTHRTLKWKPSRVRQRHYHLFSDIQLI